MNMYMKKMVWVMNLLMLVSVVTGVATEGGKVEGTTRIALGTSRNKLLLNRYEPTAAPAGAEAAKLQLSRIRGEKCSNSDIAIIQGPSSPLPSGIPTYVVEIMNICTTGCDISEIHLSCGWFSSARLINPRIFKRLQFNDCLVNEGKPLVNGRTVSFEYANTFPYPLRISSLIC